MTELLTPDNIIAFLTLSLMEIVLGVDNIIFIAILCGKLPVEQRDKIRKIGIMLALVMRIGLLFSIAWVMRLTEPLFTLFDHSFSGRDLILLCGGLFLIGKATLEIHHKVEGEAEGDESKGGVIAKVTANAVLFQIIILDIVFSLDSVITAVGMVSNIPIMLAAMIVSVIVMLVLSGSISDFVENHPTVKILALAFLILIGVMLTMEGMGNHVEKGYIYFAMFFSVGVELLNMRYRSKRKA